MADNLQQENEALRQRVAELEAALAAANAKKEPSFERYSSAPFPDFPSLDEQPLSRSEVERYGRQLIMKEIGAKGSY